MIANLGGGGAEKIVLLISEELARNNEIHLIIHDPCSNAYPIPNSINVHYLSQKSHLSKFNLINRIKFISRCKKTLKNIEVLMEFLLSPPDLAKYKKGMRFDDLPRKSFSQD